MAAVSRWVESEPGAPIDGRSRALLRSGVPAGAWRYRLGVRTRGSQPRDRGSIPRTATIHATHLDHATSLRTGRSRVGHCSCDMDRNIDETGSGGTSPGSSDLGVAVRERPLSMAVDEFLEPPISI